MPKTNASDYSAYIELTDLGNIITQIPCRHILLAVDACYSGAIDQAIVFRGRDFGRPNDTPSTERDNIVYKQLRNPSRLLITSGGKQRTPDGKDHSPFAGAILAGLRAAYSRGDGLFTFTDLLGHLERVTPTPHQGVLPQHGQGGVVFVATPPEIRTSNNFVLIQGGSFEMGDTFGDGRSDEKPVHRVVVSDFYIGVHEVTFDEYDAFCDATGCEKPSDENWGRGQHPVINVSWYDAVEYCNWRSRKENLQEVYIKRMASVDANWNANGYRLPTEAEWEFAARQKGENVRFGNGKNIANPNEINLVAYSKSTSCSEESVNRQKTVEVGSLSANNLGLYDMSGNVWEWCWDWYDSSYYKKSKDSQNPTGPRIGSHRVIRGGSWGNDPAFVRCTTRAHSNPTYGRAPRGFRLAMSAR